MKTKILNNYGALELARNLALVYGLTYSYQQLNDYIAEFPKLSLKDLSYLRVHIMMVMRCLMDDLHDFALDYATKDISGNKFFRLQSQLFAQMVELRQLL